MYVRRLGFLLQCLAETADVVSPATEIMNYESYVVIPRCLFKEIHI